MGRQVVCCLVYFPFHLRASAVMQRKIKVLSVFGTRPEAIKMSPIVAALAQDPTFDANVCVTGQHRQMLDQVLDLFAISPDFDLNIMKSGQSLADITAQILLELPAVLTACSPYCTCTRRYYHNVCRYFGVLLPKNPCRSHRSRATHLRSAFSFS